MVCCCSRRITEQSIATPLCKGRARCATPAASAVAKGEAAHDTMSPSTQLQEMRP